MTPGDSDAVIAQAGVAAVASLLARGGSELALGAVKHVAIDPDPRSAAIGWGLQAAARAVARDVSAALVLAERARVVIAEHHLSYALAVPAIAAQILASVHEGDGHSARAGLLALRLAVGCAPPTHLGNQVSRVLHATVDASPSVAAARSTD